MLKVREIIQRYEEIEEIRLGVSSSSVANLDFGQILVRELRNLAKCWLHVFPMEKRVSHEKRLFLKIFGLKRCWKPMENV